MVVKFRGSIISLEWLKLGICNVYVVQINIVGYGDPTHSIRDNINNLLRYLNVRNI